MSKGKGKIKELLKKWKVDDIVIKTDKEMMSACKRIAKAMMFTVHEVEKVENEDKNDNKQRKRERGEDGIFVLADAYTDAVLHFGGDCTFTIPRSEDKKTFIFKDLVNNMDLRAYVLEKDDVLNEKLKTIENNEEICGLIVRYLNNDITVSPIYINIYDTIANRAQEMKDIMFVDERTLTDDELEFVIDDITNAVGIVIYDTLRKMFVFTEDRKKELLKKEIDKMQKNILLKTLAEDNSKKKGRNVGM